jgi:hypothetical protein
VATVFPDLLENEHDKATYPTHPLVARRELSPRTATR